MLDIVKRYERSGRKDFESFYDVTHEMALDSDGRLWCRDASEGTPSPWEDITSQVHEGCPVDYYPLTLDYKEVTPA